jgi:hypothetical protein
MPFSDTLARGSGAEKFWFVCFILSYFILYKKIPGIFFVEMLEVADIVLGI